MRTRIEPNSALCGVDLNRSPQNVAESAECVRSSVQRGELRNQLRITFSQFAEFGSTVSILGSNQLRKPTPHFAEFGSRGPP